MQEGGDNLWIKLRASTVLQLSSSLLERDRLAVWASRNHGVKRIDHRDNTGANRDIFPDQPVRVALPIPTFVMGHHDAGQMLEYAARLFEDLASYLRVAAHDFPFITAQRARFVQDSVRHTNFTDIMEESSQAN